MSRWRRIPGYSVSRISFWLGAGGRFPQPVRIDVVLGTDWGLAATLNCHGMLPFSSRE